VYGKFCRHRHGCEIMNRCNRIQLSQAAKTKQERVMHSNREKRKRGTMTEK
jgi:hypothetical protein